MYQALGFPATVSRHLAEGGSLEELRSRLVVVPRVTYGIIEVVHCVPALDDYYIRVRPLSGGTSKVLWGSSDLGEASIVLDPEEVGCLGPPSPDVLDWQYESWEEVWERLQELMERSVSRRPVLREEEHRKVRATVPGKGWTPDHADLVEVSECVLGELDGFQALFDPRVAGTAEMMVALQELAQEPFISWVRVAEGPTEKAFLICRNYTPPSSVPPRHPLGQWVSYKAPLGRVASCQAGEEVLIQVPTGERTFRLLESLTFRPQKAEARWDGEKAIFTPPARGVSIKSLRRFTAGDGGASAAVRDVLSELALPDQALLDRVQDEAFRVSLRGVVLITGPAGAGKTTLMIRRLSLKTKERFLRESEKNLGVGVGQLSELLNPKRSWLLFCPSPALREFVKGALKREAMERVDENVRTWEEVRRELLRVVFPHIEKDGVMRERSRGTGYTAERCVARHRAFREMLTKERLGVISSERVRKRLGDSRASRDPQDVRLALLEEDLRAMPDLFRTFRSSAGVSSAGAGASVDRAAPLDPEDVDIIIAESLRIARPEVRELAAAPDTNGMKVRQATVGAILRSLRTVIAIDEASDFSPTEIACISLLSNPFLGGVTMVGDVRQRVVTKGVRDWSTLAEITTLRSWTRFDMSRGYRQISGLDRAASLMVSEAAETARSVATRTEEVAPLFLFAGHWQSREFEEWADTIMRVRSVDSAGQPLSLAVIVPSEADLGSASERLARALGTCLPIEICTAGKSETRGGALRLFSYEHVKGLEFEGVLFLDVDRLPDDLANQILYVGLTRARSFFAATCAGPLPEALRRVEKLFSTHGSATRRHTDAKP